MKITCMKHERQNKVAVWMNLEMTQYVNQQAYNAGVANSIWIRQLIVGHYESTFEIQTKPTPAIQVMQTPKRSSNINVWIDEAMYNEIERRSEREGITVSAIARKAIEQSFRKEQNQ
jgi:hypothetical protein